MYWIGTITGASGAYSNYQTGHSGLGTFTIPANTKALYLVPSASGLLFELGAATGTTQISFQTSAARGAQLTGPGIINGPFRTAGQYAVVSVWNPIGGFLSVRVYADPGK